MNLKLYVKETISTWKQERVVLRKCRIARFLVEKKMAKTKYQIDNSTSHTHLIAFNSVDLRVIKYDRV